MRGAMAIRSAKNLNLIHTYKLYSCKGERDKISRINLVVFKLDENFCLDNLG